MSLATPMLASRPDHDIRAVTFSPDGTKAYWPVINSEDDFRRWIVGARMDKGEWAQPGIAPFSDARFYDDVPCLAPNGQELFFLSGRPREEGGEGFGSLDIYCSPCVDGTFQAPADLGPQINSAGADSTPPPESGPGRSGSVMRLR